MNVNCKVSLTDEQRNVMFRNINNSDSTTRRVTRKEVNEFVEKKIAEALNGKEEPQTIDLLDPRTHEAAFKPTRGDEPYILKVKDESLRAIHTRMLDCIEEYEAAVWGEIDKNTR